MILKLITRCSEAQSFYLFLCTAAFMHQSEPLTEKQLRPVPRYYISS